jgi:hypothetical protein
MTHISGFERSQLLLLPEAVDDYVVADNPVRFIDAFVDGLDLAAAGFKRVTPKVTGRPGYAPADPYQRCLHVADLGGRRREAAQSARFLPNQIRKFGEDACPAALREVHTKTSMSEKKVVIVGIHGSR